MMRYLVAGFNCEVTDKNPKPDEIREFTGDNFVVVEAEILAFAARFKWFQFQETE